MRIALCTIYFDVVSCFRLGILFDFTVQNKMSDEEEEIIVYVEFNEMLHEDILQEPNVAFKVIGYDTEHPIMQIGDEIYEGEYEDACGTNVIFDEDANPSQRDKVFGKEVSNRLQYLCKTNKVLKMNRIFISEKNTATKSTNDEQVTKFAETYEEALNKLSECYVQSQSDNTHNDVKKIE